MNYFAKFEKFLPHNIIMPSFMIVGSQMPDLHRVRYIIGFQNPPYKIGLNDAVQQAEMPCGLILFQYDINFPA